MSNVFTEPHSTKQIEDTIGSALETDAETLVATIRAPSLDAGAVRRLAAQIQCPSLVIHGSEDPIRAPGSCAALAELLHAELAMFDGSGHNPHARDPVKVNLMMRDFIQQRPTSARTCVSRSRRPRHAHRRSDAPRSRASRR